MLTRQNKNKNIIFFPHVKKFIKKNRKNKKKNLNYINLCLLR